MSKKAIIILIVSIVLLISLLGTAIALIVHNHNDEPPSVTDTPSQTEKEEIVIPKIEGNEDISDEREVLLDKNIIAIIDQSTAKNPVVSDDGNYVTDENGNLVFEEAYDTDYTNVKENLAVIVNAFADANYPQKVIKYVQRFYFEYYVELSEYESEDLINKLKYCFQISGNTTEMIAKAAYETFGFDREDQFAFVMEEPLPPSETVVLFFDVKPKTEFEWTDELEHHCIYELWHNEDSDDNYERNMEAYLHSIVYNLKTNGASDFNICLAELVYCGFLADAEYRADWLETVKTVFTASDIKYETLRDTLLDEFGFDIYSNQLISNYYDGISEFNIGGDVD